MLDAREGEPVSALEAGDYVRHLKMPAWGYGRVVAVEAELLAVRFEHEAGEKRFKIAGAASLLERVSADDVPSPVKAGLADRRSGYDRKAREVPTAAKCDACGGRLNRSRYSVDGRWKSCPKCSVAHGTQHVFRPRPDGFGTTAERETTDNAEGIQSYCNDCRQGVEPSLRGDDVRLCADLSTQAKQP